MSDTPEQGPIDEHELLVHRLYRERIVQEDNLINHRMTWMILSQAFLMALWAALAQAAFNGHNLLRFPMGLIVIVGGLFAYGSYQSIRAAQKEIDELRVRYLQLYQESDTPRNRVDLKRPVADNRLPGLTGSKFNHFFGHLVPRCMPWALVIVWTTLLVPTAIGS